MPHPFRFAIGGFAAVSVMALVVSLVALRQGPQTVLTIALPAAATPPATEPEEANVPPEPETDEIGELTIHSNTCDPRRGTMDSVAGDRLRKMVAQWIADPRTSAPRIDAQRGVTYVHSAEDEGDDAPTPPGHGAEATIVCGRSAQWLRSHVVGVLAEQARMGNLTCDELGCCYRGQEFMQSGRVTFGELATRDQRSTWVLESFVEVQDAGVSREEIATNEAFVWDATLRLSNGRCPKGKAR